MTNKKSAIFVLLNDFADWEPAHLLNMLRADGWQTKIASNESTIKSLGGLTIVPDLSIADIPNSIDLLVLIGGNSWKVSLPKLTHLIAHRLKAGQPVAAICGAVDYLATNGLLTDYKHTGNAQYLWHDYTQYHNPESFINEQAVRDRNLVTANGTATLTFTNEVLKLVNAKSAHEIDKQTDLYRLGFYNYTKKYGNPFS